MRAVGVTEVGGPEKLRVLDVAEPHPEAGEVRIRVHAATVNPTDTALRAGQHRIDGLAPPYIPGMDAAGVISEVGDGVTTSQVGDRVMAVVVPIDSRGGAYADEIVVPANSVVPVPEGVDFAAASTLPMNGLTAHLALEQLGLSPGETLAVTGAAGSFGGYVIQLAKTKGLHVIADASAADENLVRELGADQVVRRGNDVAERIRELVPEGVAGVADGAVLNGEVAPAIRDGGGLAVVRGWNGDPGRGITVHRVMVVESVEDRAALDGLRKQVEQGVLSLRVAKVFPADQAAEAHRVLEAGGTRGRLVLDFTS
ncbi:MULTISPECIES: quinone oxidoreductase family protein [Actinopolyspora]|uniref:NADPH:quinone reductase n=1 Tax=Actinopolyspora saharensis TaxID=995062 RepID=A0A1H1A452_9ACTN|nr:MULTISPECIES: NADP-dependent oxidoreductase [Actinopolyspora]NHD16837.1 NADP-dependent oxidoreductase [Actinopolyspora sp. BKK2]NHE75989.1 NADP-dependent oxidoreductase [Actinopolyspora sp. BKK1]SDQ34422.1 NADPH:quinone reductase [Actinopolyspora saharensis]